MSMPSHTSRRKQVCMSNSYDGDATRSSFQQTLEFWRQLEEKAHVPLADSPCRNASWSNLLVALSSGHGDGPAAMAAAVAVARVASACARAKVARME